MTHDDQTPVLHLKVLGYMELEDADGCPVLSVLRRPKLAAFLGVLAVGDAAVRSREQLMAMFWPEADAERASHSLNQLVYRLRKALGDVVDRRGDQLVVDRARLSCDAYLFADAFERGDIEEAVGLYRGDLLDGLYVSDAPGFERWVEEQRARLSRKAAQAFWTLAERYASESRFLEASTTARRAAACTPGEEAALRRLLGFLDGIGDRASALAAYDDFARLLLDEYQATPSPETSALVERIRNRDEVVADLPVRTPRIASAPADDAPPDSALRGVQGERGAQAPGQRAAARSRPKLRWLVVPALALAALVGRFVVDGLGGVVESGAMVVSIEAPAGDADDEAVRGITRALVGDLAGADRFRVVADPVPDFATLDLTVSLARYRADDVDFVEARLVDPETRAILAVQSFPEEQAPEAVVRFVRHRAGAIAARRALEEGASEDQIEELRRADGMIGGGLRHRSDRRLLAAWAHFSAADTVLARLEEDAPRWVEPPLRRGWLGIDRVLTLAGAEAIDSIALGVAPGPAALAALLDEAERFADRVIEIDDAAGWGYELRGVVSYTRLEATVFSDTVAGRRAEEDLGRAVEIDPHLTRAWRRLSKLRDMQGDPAGALVALDQAIESDPYLTQDRMIRWAVLRTAAWTNDQARARDACADGLRDFPDDPAFAECELFLESWLGDVADIERAERAFEGLDLGAMPGVERRHLRMMYLAAASARAGDADGARNVLREASLMAPGPDSVAAAIERVRVLSLLDEPGAATDSLTALVGRLPGLRAGIPRDARYRQLAGYPDFEALVASLRSGEG